MVANQNALNLMTERDLERLAGIGQRVVDGARRGGRRNPDRDRQMAHEFRQRRSTNVSVTALKIKIGLEHGLRRSAAIAAVDRGLKIIRSVSSEPDATL